MLLRLNRHQGRQGFVVRAALLVAAAVALIVVLYAVIIPAIQETEASDAFGVYLEPADVSSESRFTIPEETLEQRGIVKVSSAEELQSVAATAYPQSVWIHDAALQTVPHDWLVNQVDSGVVIVGIDTTKRALADVLGVVAGPSADWRHPTKPTFVIYYRYRVVEAPLTNQQGQPTTRGGWAWSNDSFDPEHLDLLFFQVEDTVQRLHELRRIEK